MLRSHPLIFANTREFISVDSRVFADKNVLAGLPNPAANADLAIRFEHVMDDLGALIS
jgi:hypothetical protein